MGHLGWWSERRQQKSHREVAFYDCGPRPGNGQGFLTAAAAASAAALAASAAPLAASTAPAAADAAPSAAAAAPEAASFAASTTAGAAAGAATGAAGGASFLPQAARAAAAITAARTRDLFIWIIPKECWKSCWKRHRHPRLWPGQSCTASNLSSLRLYKSCRADSGETLR